MNKYKRCIDCDAHGHFKCRDEAKSNLMKVSFDVGNDIDEFLMRKLDELKYRSDSSEGDEAMSKKERKRDKKLKEKKSKKNKKKKKKSSRRLSNSNILMPISDESCFEETSSSEEDHMPVASKKKFQSQKIANREF